MRVVIDRALYLPKDWAADEERRTMAGIPEEITFATKLEQTATMVGSLGTGWGDTERVTLAGLLKAARDRALPVHRCPPNNRSLRGAAPPDRRSTLHNPHPGRSATPPVWHRLRPDLAPNDITRPARPALSR